MENMNVFIKSRTPSRGQAGGSHSAASALSVYWKIFTLLLLSWGCCLAAQPISAGEIQVHLADNSALAAVEKGDYKRAVSKLEALLRADLAEPERKEIHHVLGYCYEKLRNRPKAIGNYARVASRTYPLADCAVYRLARLYAEMKDDAKAVKWYTHLVANYPASFYRAEAQLALARLHLKRKAWAAAKPLFAALSEETRYAREAAQGAARCDEGLGDVAAAFEAYRALLQANATDAVAEETLGRFKLLARTHKTLTLTTQDRLICGKVFLNRKKWKLAVAEFQRIASTKNLKLRGQARYLMGQAYQGRKWYNTAIKQYNVVIALGGKSDYLTRAHYQKAVCYQRKGHLKTATSQLKPFTRLYPWSELRDDALYTLAQIYQKRGKLTLAHQTYAQLIEIAPESPYADFAAWRIGWQRFDEKRYEESYKAFKGLKENFPGNRYAMGAHFWMAKIRERQNRPEVAREIYTEVAEANYWYYSARAKAILNMSHSELAPRAVPDAELPDTAACPPQAKALMALRLYDDAIVQLKHHITTPNVSSDTACFYALIDCYERQARYDEARKVAEQALNGLVLTNPNAEETKQLRQWLYPRYYEQLVEKYAKAHGVDAYLMFAMMLEESRYRADAVSWAGAIGLMQIMPATGKELARQLKIRRFRSSMLKQPEVNIRMGAKYIAYLNSLFDGDAMLVTGAYNGGPGRMRRWVESKKIADIDEFVEKITIRETRLHIKKVIHSYDNYVEIYGQEETPAVNAVRDRQQIRSGKRLGSPFIGQRGN